MAVPAEIKRSVLNKRLTGTAVYYFEQILNSESDKTEAAWQLTSHFTNYQCKKKKKMLGTGGETGINSYAKCMDGGREKQERFDKINHIMMSSFMVMSRKRHAMQG